MKYPFLQFKLLFILVLFSTSVDANPKDSLAQIITTERDDAIVRSVIKSLVNICGSDRGCIDGYIPIVKEKGLPYLANYYRQAAFQFMRHEDFEHALHYLKPEAAIYGELGELGKLPELYTLISQMHSGLVQMDSTFWYVNKALNAYEEKGDAYHIWKAYYSRAEAFRQIEDIDRALMDMEKAYAIVKAGDSRMDIGFVFYYLLNWYANLTDQSNRYFALLDEYMVYKQEGATPTQEFHMELDIFDDPETGIEKLELHLAHVDPTVGYNTISVSYRHLGELYQLSGQHRKAAKAFEQAAQLMEAKGQLYLLKNTYRMQYEAYKALGDMEQALAAMERMQEAHERIFAEEQMQAVRDIQAKYETEKKDRAIAEKALQLEQRTNQLTITIGILAFLVVASIVLHMWYTKRARLLNTLTAKEQQLQQQRITELEQQNKLLALSAMLEGQEAERMRISRDLHDGIGGMLTTVKAYFNSLPQAPEGLQNPELYNKTNALINEACVEVRRVAHNLVPQTLSLSGLQGTIEDLGEHLEAQGLKCDIVVEGIPHNIDQTQGIMIFRILQELANNILKHAEASIVLLQAIVYEDTLNLLVEDNGKGFNTSRVADGHGLQNVQWRVNYLHGTMEYESTPGVGTTFTISIPLVGLHTINGRKRTQAI